MNSDHKAVAQGYKNKKRVDGLKVFTWIIVILWTILICGVLAITIMLSLKSSVKIFQNPWSLPDSFEDIVKNYTKAWVTSQMGTYLFNSVIIVSISLMLTLIVSAMASYILTRFNFWGRKFLTVVLLLGQGIPLQLMLIPLYKMLSNFGMVDTYPGLIIVYATACIPFTVYVLTGFFSTVPGEVIEAATIDGCSQNRLFWEIVIPLVKPGLIAVTSFNFTWMWNEYLLALVFTSSKSLRTISLGMYSLQGSMTFTVDWGALFAGVVIMLIPAAVVFGLLNKYVISGATIGAVKG